jgi:hypothetical protein
MSNITITISANNALELSAQLKTLLQSMTNASLDTAPATPAEQPAPTPAAAPEPQTLPIEPKQEEQAKARKPRTKKTDAAAPLMEAVKSAEPDAEEEEEEEAESAPSDKRYTHIDLKDLLQKTFHEYGDGPLHSARTIFKEYGVSKTSDIPDDKIHEIYLRVAQVCKGKKVSA